MMTDAQLKARDSARDIGVELLQSAHEMTAGQWTRKTTFEPLADGSVRRTVVSADGTLEKQEVLAGPQWQLMAARAQSGLSQSEFARATGVSVRTHKSGSRAARCPAGLRKACSS